MKKIVVFGVVLSLLLSVFTGCAQTQPSAKQGISVDSAGVSPTSDGAPPEKQGEIKSAVLIISGNLGDKGFSDLANAGLKRAEQELGLKVKVVELGGDTTKQVPVLTEFAEDSDWDLIISGTYGMKEAIEKVAAENPEAKFLVYDAQMDYTGGKNKNVCSVEHRQYEASFLAGALASAMTTSGAGNTNVTKLVGFIGGGENISINDFLVGYIQGVQYVDKDCKVLISYVGDFTNSAKAKEMTIAQCNQGADIVYAVAGGASLGVLDGAAETGCFSIGVDQDQYEALRDKNLKQAEQIVTSVVKRLDNTIFNMAKGACDGTLQWGTHSYVGLKEKSMGLAVNDQYKKLVPPEVQKFIFEIEEKLLTGELKPESAFGMSTERITEYKNSAKP